jgi:hypothetical protein
MTSEAPTIRPIETRYGGYRFRSGRRPTPGACSRAGRTGAATVEGGAARSVAHGSRVRHFFPERVAPVRHFFPERVALNFEVSHPKCLRRREKGRVRHFLGVKILLPYARVRERSRGSLGSVAPPPRCGCGQLLQGGDFRVEHSHTARGWRGGPQPPVPIGRKSSRAAIGHCSVLAAVSAVAVPLCRC